MEELARICSDVARQTAASHSWLVRSTGPEEALASIGIPSEGDLLVVATDDRGAFFLPWVRRSGAEMRFAVPTMDSLETTSRGFSGSRLIWAVSSLGGSDLDVPDIKGIGRAARTSGALLVVDNTLATMRCSAACRMAAHVSVEWFACGVCAVSLSRDAMANDSSLVASVEDAAARLAPTAGQLATIDSWIANLSSCMRRRNDNASVVAAYLSCHPRVSWCSYPGLASSPGQRGVPCSLEWGFGPCVDFMVSPELRGSYDAIMGGSGALGSPSADHDDTVSRLILVELSDAVDRRVSRRHFFRYFAGIGDAAADVTRLERAISAAAR